MTGADFKQWL